MSLFAFGRPDVNYLRNPTISNFNLLTNFKDIALDTETKYI
jgi:hypothetical protein